MYHDSSYVWNLIPAHLVIMFAPGSLKPGCDNGPRDGGRGTLQHYGAAIGKRWAAATPMKRGCFMQSHALDAWASGGTTRNNCFAECLMKNTRRRLCRVWHSVKKARRTVHWQWLLCRVLFIGHSTKTLLSVARYSTKRSRRHGAR
jgi:hypothetical protein